MKYWTADKIKAYNEEIAERIRLDRASSKAYMEDLLREKDVMIADKDALIAKLQSRIASLEAASGA